MICVLGNKIDLPALRKVKLVQPDNAGAYWQGVKHSDFVDTIIDEVYKRKWKIHKSEFALSSDKADLVGAFELKVTGIEIPEGQRLSLGFTTSNARRRSMKISVGSRVLVCNNGVVTGEVVMSKKHTTGFDLKLEVDAAMDQYEDMAHGLLSDVNELKGIDIDQDMFDRIIMQASRITPKKSRMRWARLWQVIQEWKNPTFDFGGETGWQLLNSFTYVAQKEPVFRQMDQIKAFHDLILENAGILAA
jgi:hypothetical protein